MTRHTLSETLRKIAVEDSDAPFAYVLHQAADLIEDADAPASEVIDDVARLTRERDEAVSNAATYERDYTAELNQRCNAEAYGGKMRALVIETTKERDEARKDWGSPVVMVTDCEKAAAEIFDVRFEGYRNALAILRKHTRTWTVEEIAEAISACPQSSCAKTLARAVLSLLGGQPSAPKRPFVVDREKVRAAYHAGFGSVPIGTFTAHLRDAAHMNGLDASIAEITAQRERWEAGR